MSEVSQFEDAESYSFGSKEKLTFKDIILMHLKKITSYSAVEFHGGMYEERTTPTGVTNKIYINDTREVYSNAVECFADMLAPYFDEEMKEAEKEANKELDDEFHDTTSFAVKKEKIGELRYWNGTEQRVTFRDLRVKTCRRLFRALCCFLYRKKYLELGVIQD